MLVLQILLSAALKITWQEKKLFNSGPASLQIIPRHRMMYQLRQLLELAATAAAT
jgi:hypothetical protein